MWRPWSRSPVRIHHRGTTTTGWDSSCSSSSNFAISTLKDIEAIFSEDSNSGPESPILRRLPSICNRVRTANNILRAWSTPESLLRDTIPESNPEIPNAVDSTKSIELETTETVPTSAKSEPAISLPGAESRIVICYTSLRVVRPTFEACKSVLAILQGFNVPIDERDLSMDSSFLSELKHILKDETLTLPQVFIDGRYVGGAHIVQHLHECGELKKLVEGLPRVKPGTCPVCGGFRFVLCEECSGGRKIYSEKGGFRSCTVCNENGLVRCPCCSFQSPLIPSRSVNCNI